MRFDKQASIRLLQVTQTMFNMDRDCSTLESPLNVPYLFFERIHPGHPYFRPPFIIFKSVVGSSIQQREKSCFYLFRVETASETHP